MPSQAYFEVDGVGDWYAAIATTSPGESPATNPEKWVKMGILEVFEQFLVEDAAGTLLQNDGQSDKRRAQRKLADEILEELLHEHAPRSGDFHRPSVMTR